MTLLLAISDINLKRIALIAGIALGAHIAVIVVRIFSQWLIGTSLGSISKAQTLTRFIASTVMFAIWIVAVGFALYELGVPLQTYIASATIIGLAVSFGAQSLVQDVIGGLTLIFGGLMEIGDMVEVSGQTGVIEKIGIRYTELRNVQGAIVSIPNRNVTNVVNHPKGYIHAFVDVRLPADHEDEAVGHIERIANAAFRQFSGIMIRMPSFSRQPSSASTSEGTSGQSYMRIKFRIWPGQGGVIEGNVRQRLIQRMRLIDPTYHESMVAVHYRVEPAFTRRAVSALEGFLRKRPKAQANE